MTTAKKNLAASVHQRLYNHARANGEDFNQLLVRFANERWLYRLSISAYKTSFLLKGASLFTLWFQAPHRPTRDIDLLGFGSNEIADIEKAFTEICQVAADDGLAFRPETVKGSEIKEGEEYQGVRVSFLALLGNARISLQVDVGFGDAVTPKPANIAFPTVLDFPAPKLKAYPKETVVAEKFEAMVKLGIANSRMKDFWDLHLMVSEFEFDGAILQEAIQATFARRQTAFPIKLPLALTDEFSNDKGKQTQWSAFLRKNRLEDSIALNEVIDLLRAFFLPLIEAGQKEKVIVQWKPVKWDG